MEAVLVSRIFLQRLRDITRTSIRLGAVPTEETSRAVVFNLGYVYLRGYAKTSFGGKRKHLRRYVNLKKKS
jgi:hypothetical protein